MRTHDQVLRQIPSVKISVVISTYFLRIMVQLLFLLLFLGFLLLFGHDPTHPSFFFFFFWGGSDCAQGDDVSGHYEDVAMVHQDVSLQGADVMRDEHHEPELTWAPSHLASYTSHL
jgi:hypothetical protein